MAGTAQAGKEGDAGKQDQQQGRTTHSPRLYSAARGASRQMPRTVAVIGASTDRRKYGNKAVRAFPLARDYDVCPGEPARGGR